MEEKNLVKIIEKIKERTDLDLSLGEDLSIALMNIISLEEHFLLSYMKTQDEKFLEFLEQTREARKRLLAKIVVKEKEDYSEKWCISKHLLSTSMRLIEVGTKYLHDKKKKEAQESFNDAFNFYSLFWVVNGINQEKDKKINPDTKRIIFTQIPYFSSQASKNNSRGAQELKSKVLDKSKISQLIKKMLDCCKE